MSTRPSDQGINSMSQLSQSVQVTRNDVNDFHHPSIVSGKQQSNFQESSEIDSMHCHSIPDGVSSTSLSKYGNNFLDIAIIRIKGLLNEVCKTKVFNCNSLHCSYVALLCWSPLLTVVLLF